MTTVSPSFRTRAVGVALFAVVLIVVVAVAARLSRTAPVATTAGHNHAAAGAAPADRSGPVRLSADASRRIGVTFAEVALGPLEREVRTVAQVTYDETRVTVVAPRVEGWVEALYVNTTGQPVRRGQPLFALYAPMVMATEQELLLARDLERGVAGGTEEARAGAHGLLESTRRRLLAWDVPREEVARLEATGEVHRTVTFRSPAAGVVIQKAVLPGQRLMPGEPVYRIADLATVWVEGEVFERDLPSVRVGQQVSAEFPALPGQHRAGRIAYIYPTLDPTTRTARVRVELPNPGLALKPGMYATVRLTAETAPVLSVPRSAVLVTGERALAFLKRADGAFEPRPVSLGRASDERLEILHGLARGDTVVASATFLVDAESNLGTILGGMGDMPGMDIRPPTDAAAHPDSHRVER
jgi:Cu(I)/Ag(I) efflux system membrane fusion protein